MLRAGAKRLDAVIYTHEHKDHVSGMDEVRAFNYIQRQVIPLYVTENVENALKREFYYAFEFPKYPGVPEVELIRIENRPFVACGVEFTPILAYHHLLPVFGFRVGGFSYLTDANRISEEELAKMEGSEVLVINALRRQSHISHFTLEEALAIIERVRPERAYLTHISHQLGLHSEVEKELPPHVRLAHDGLQFTLDK
jgi:phosphoribosyl 1,2-cyclic phosphate phosphodiesterase